MNVEAWGAVRDLVSMFRSWYIPACGFRRMMTPVLLAVELVLMTLLAPLTERLSWLRLQVL